MKSVSIDLPEPRESFLWVLELSPEEYSQKLLPNIKEGIILKLGKNCFTYKNQTIWRKIKNKLPFFEQEYMPTTPDPMPCIGDSVIYSIYSPGYIPFVRATGEHISLILDSAIKFYCPAPIT